MAFWILAATIDCPECGKTARLRQVLRVRRLADGTRVPSDEVEYICPHCGATGGMEDVELPK
jgi:hypothetical protein